MRSPARMVPTSRTTTSRRGRRRWLRPAAATLVGGMIAPLGGGLLHAAPAAALPGAVLWSEPIGSVNTDDARSVATDAANNTYVVGQFGFFLDIGAVSLTSNGASDGY